MDIHRCSQMNSYLFIIDEGRKSINSFAKDFKYCRIEILVKSVSKIWSYILTAMTHCKYCYYKKTGDNYVKQF